MTSTRFLPAKRFLLAAAGLLLIGLGASPELKGAPLYGPLGTFLPKSSHEALYARMLAGSRDNVDFDWFEAPSADAVPDPQGSLRGAILVTLLVGSILRFLTSDTVRNYFRETFDPLKWDSYQ